MNGKREFFFSLSHLAYVICGFCERNLRGMSCRVELLSNEYASSGGNKLKQNEMTSNKDKDLVEWRWTKQESFSFLSHLAFLHEHYFHIPRFLMYDVTMLLVWISLLVHVGCCRAGFLLFRVFLGGVPVGSVGYEVHVKYIFGRVFSSVLCWRSGGWSQKNMQKKQVCVSFVDWSSKVFGLYV